MKKGGQKCIFSNFEKLCKRQGWFFATNSRAKGAPTLALQARPWARPVSQRASQGPSPRRQAPRRIPCETQGKARAPNTDCRNRAQGPSDFAKARPGAQPAPHKPLSLVVPGNANFEQGPEIVAKARPGGQPEATSAKPSLLAKVLRHKPAYSKTIPFAQRFSKIERKRRKLQIPKPPRKAPKTEKRAPSNSKLAKPLGIPLNSCAANLKTSLPKFHQKILNEKVAKIYLLPGEHFKFL